MSENESPTYDKTAIDVLDLTRIFDLFPHLSGVTLKTRHGDLQVTRDFPSNYTAEVDAMLATIFENDPGIAGIVFPATSTQPEHTATPDDPHWSPDGKALAAIDAALKAGEISTDQAMRKIKEIHLKE
ncbi:hypothetical protein [Brucella intermedia]|uniref:hypothetical protein n=1 Tax=Brucella intermedia TaxID=94625 RepID=UPI00224B8873|nr:hypothetical protein [Brucella intermedia]